MEEVGHGHLDHSDGDDKLESGSNCNPDDQTINQDNHDDARNVSFHKQEGTREPTGRKRK